MWARCALALLMALLFLGIVLPNLGRVIIDRSTTPPTLHIVERTRDSLIAVGIAAVPLALVLIGKAQSSLFDRARAALALTPDLPLAHQIITLCSCGLHRAEDAKLAFAHLDPARRNLVRTLCEKDEVILDSD